MTETNVRRKPAAPPQPKQYVVTLMVRDAPESGEAYLTRAELTDKLNAIDLGIAGLTVESTRIEREALEAYVPTAEPSAEG